MASKMPQPHSRLSWSSNQVPCGKAKARVVLLAAANEKREALAWMTLPLGAFSSGNAPERASSTVQVPPWLKLPGMNIS